MISELPSGVIENQVRYYIDHVDDMVKKMHNILHTLLKTRNIRIPTNTKGTGKKLQEGLHPSMKNMYNNKILGLKDLYGLTSLLDE